MERVEIASTPLEQIANDLRLIKNSIAEFNKTKDLLNIFLEGERKYRSLYVNSPDMYRTINTEGIIIDCNDAYAENLGYTKREVVGGSIYDHVIDRDLNAMRESFEVWLDKGSVKNREIWFKKKDGTAFPALISATTIYGENGDIVGSNTIIRDITEIHSAKRRVEETAKEITKLSEDLKDSITQNSMLVKYKEMFEQLPDLIRAVDLKGIIHDCNIKYANEFGYTKEQVIGASIYDHTAERSMNVMRGTFGGWISTGIDETREIWCKRKDGSEFPTLLTVTNITNPDSKIIGRIASLRIM